MKIQIIAHRGASKEAPENTLAAIQRALSLNCHCVEIDVRLSKDGVPIVLHDDSVARMIGSEQSPSIDQLTLSQLQQFDVGKQFAKEFTAERIPTLLEVLSLAWNQTGLMIEIKECPQNPKFLVDAVFNVLCKAKKLPSFLILGSFSLEILKEIYKHTAGFCSPIEVIGIIEEPEMIARFAAQKVKYIALWHKLITKEIMESLKARNIEIWSFTIDDPHVAKDLISLGVKGIISNDPKIMMEEFVIHNPCL